MHQYVINYHTVDLEDKSKKPEKGQFYLNQYSGQEDQFLHGLALVIADYYSKAPNIIKVSVTHKVETDEEIWSRP